MAIIQLRDNEPLPQHMACVICRKEITPAVAVAGLLDADNCQQFACNGHFWNSHQLIAGWANFMASERRQRTSNQFAFEYGGDIDARTLR